MKTLSLLFKTLQQHIASDDQFKDVLGDRMYLSLPERPTYPCLVFGVDEFLDNNDSCYVKFHLQLVSPYRKGMELLKIGQGIDALVTLADLKGAGGISLACRRANMVVDFPMNHKPQTIKYFYKAMIWRQA